jgi:hypothetical protein
MARLWRDYGAIASKRRDSASRVIDVLPHGIVWACQWGGDFKNGSDMALFLLKYKRTRETNSFLLKS